MNTLARAGIVLLLCARPTSAGPLEVPTDRGRVRGRNVGAVDQFLGVPFAAPPVGDLRFRPPASAAPWEGLRDATRPGRACLQPGRDLSSTDEDCLYLNLYRPANAGALAPVLVFLHGGSNVSGSGDQHDPSAMVEKTGVIVVTLNYRLNVFGFLALPSLDLEAEDGSSGNLGLLDQQAALRWVRANARAFGGDPEEVTVAGHSAGSVDACAHLASPTAAGLFRRTILQSRECRTVTHDDALAQGTPLAVGLGCTDASTAAACLRAKPREDLLEASGAREWGPNVGGSVLPQAPLEAFRSGRWNRAPVLLGSTHDEASAEVLSKTGFPLSVPDYQRFVALRFGPFAAAVLREYPLDDYDDPALALIAASTDAGIACPVSHLANALSGNTPTFRYEFSDPHAPVPLSWGLPPAISIGAYHGGEMPFLFDDTRDPARPLSPAQQALSDQMQRYWANFTRTGDPNGAGLVRWPRHEADTREVLSLDPDGNSVIGDFDADHHCAFWGSIGLQ